MPAANDWPRTVDEAVDRLISVLSDENKQVIRDNTEGNLIDYHFGLGMYIRNQFGLWAGNKALLESCVAQRGHALVSHPDYASAIIIEALRRRLWQDG
jgi:hypothetical protein